MIPEMPKRAIAPICHASITPGPIAANPDLLFSGLVARMPSQIPEPVSNPAPTPSNQPVDKAAAPPAQSATPQPPVVPPPAKPAAPPVDDASG